MIFAFDLDGTITAWDMEGGYHPSKIGSVMLGAVETLAWARRRGHKVIIFTCRTNPFVNNRWGYSFVQLLGMLEELLYLHHIPYDDIAVFKPDADWFFDDKANFTTWDAVKEKIIELEENSEG